MTFPTSDRRTAKRLATRQRISDVATRLFLEHGFDRVTVDEIAKAANVSRMTVFNHFARKEDMLFDLDDLGRQEILAALEEKAPDMSPVEALRRHAHWAIAERRPYLLLCEAGSEQFVATVRSSDALTARARAIRDELTALLTGAFVRVVGYRGGHAAAHLAASMVVATWTVAFLEAHQTYLESRNEAKAYATFLQLIDEGSEAARLALRDTFHPWNGAGMR